MKRGSADGPKLQPVPDVAGGDDAWEEPALGGRGTTTEPSHPTELTALEPALAAMDTAHLPSYGDLYARRRAGVADWKRWSAVAVAAVVAGPFAVFGAFFGQFATAASLFWVLTVIALGPALEEMLKAVGALYLAEQRPWYVPAAWTLAAVTVVSGLVFATIENLIYLNVYISDPSGEIVRWRWIAGPALHCTASLIAGLGVARMWTETDREGMPPRLRIALPFLVAATVLHGAYNATVVVLEASGAIF